MESKPGIDSLSKDEIAKFIKDSIPELQEVISNMTGTRINIPANNPLVPILTDFIDYLRQWSKADFSKMSISERKQMMNDLMVYMIKTAGEDDRIGDPVEYFLGVLSAPFAEPPIIEFAKNTNFAAYRNALFTIVGEVLLKKKDVEIEDIFSSCPEEDAYAMTQSTIELNRKLPYLNKKHKKITKQVVQKYISIYGEVAAHMEKMVMQLFAINKVLKGEKIDYSTLKKSKLNDYVESLRSTPIFSDLVVPFNVTIRNSVAHKGTIFSPLVRIVKFVDKKKSIPLGYEEFVNHTRELATADFVVSHIENVMTLHRMRALQARLG